MVQRNKRNSIGATTKPLWCSYRKLHYFTTSNNGYTEPNAMGILMISMIIDNVYVCKWIDKCFCCLADDDDVDKTKWRTNKQSCNPVKHIVRSLIPNSFRFTFLSFAWIILNARRKRSCFAFTSINVRRISMKRKYNISFSQIFWRR